MWCAECPAGAHAHAAWMTLGTWWGEWRPKVCREYSRKGCATGYNKVGLLGVTCLVVCARVWTALVLVRTLIQNRLMERSSVVWMIRVNALA